MLVNEARLREVLAQCKTFIYDWLHNYVDEDYARRVEATIDDVLATTGKEAPDAS